MASIESRKEFFNELCMTFDHALNLNTDPSSKDELSFPKDDECYQALADENLGNVLFMTIYACKDYRDAGNFRTEITYEKLKELSLGKKRTTADLLEKMYRNWNVITNVWKFSSKSLHNLCVKSVKNVCDSFMREKCSYDHACYGRLLVNYLRKKKQKSDDGTKFWTRYNDNRFYDIPNETVKAVYESLKKSPDNELMHRNFWHVISIRKYEVYVTFGRKFGLTASLAKRLVSKECSVVDERDSNLMARCFKKCKVHDIDVHSNQCLINIGKEALHEFTIMQSLKITTLDIVYNCFNIPRCLVLQSSHITEFNYEDVWKNFDAFSTFEFGVSYVYNDIDTTTPTSDFAKTMCALCFCKIYYEVARHQFKTTCNFFNVDNLKFRTINSMNNAFIFNFTETAIHTRTIHHFKVRRHKNTALVLPVFLNTNLKHINKPGPGINRHLNEQFNKMLDMVGFANIHKIQETFIPSEILNNIISEMKEHNNVVYSTERQNIR
jgi:hypothetical protein